MKSEKVWTGSFFSFRLAAQGEGLFDGGTFAEELALKLFHRREVQMVPDGEEIALVLVERVLHDCRIGRRTEDDADWWIVPGRIISRS